MSISSNIPSSWKDYGVKDFLSLDDSTIFGSLKIGKEFKSKNFVLSNSGTKGVDTITNKILIAQLTTQGELSFSLNLEVLELINGVPTKVQYVANDSILLKDNNGHNEKYSGYLTYPVTCGCLDPNYLEYNPKVVCQAEGACKSQIVIGCMDSMACNFDPKANVMIHNLCCYPGMCNDRDIAKVCPSQLENDVTFEIHPNPTNDFIYLSASTGTIQKFKYELFNAYGQTLLIKELGVVSQISNETIDLTGFENGLYHIRLLVGDTVQSALIIKNW